MDFLVRVEREDMKEDIFTHLQELAVEARDKSGILPPWELHIIGGPGCGKTTRLYQLVEQAIKRFGPEKIMVCSFTDAAAWNALNRLKSIPGIETSKEKRRIRTLHSFAYRQLGGDTKITEVHFLKEWNKSHPEIRLSDRSTDDSNTEVKTLGDTLLAEVQRNRALKKPETEWNIQARNFYGKWRRFKRETGSMDFTDIIQTCLEDERYHCPPNDATVIFVDEAQDLSPLELELIRKWGESATYVFLFYDPNQCIYAWKGARPAALTENPEHIIYREVIENSYRLPKAVHRENLRWMENLPTAVIEHKPKEAPGIVKVASDITLSSPEQLTHDIAAQGYIKNGQQVMILTTCGYMLDRIKGRLFAEGIPFGNPYRPDDREWNPLKKSLSDESPNCVDRFRTYLLPDAKTYGEEARLPYASEIKVIVETLRPGILRDPQPEQAESQLYGSQLLESLQDPVSIEVIRRLFIPEVAEKILHPDVDWYLKNIRKQYQTKVTSYAVDVYKRFGGIILVSTPTYPPVIIGTVHSVKGGEADIVYLFPDLSPAGWEQYHGQGRGAVVRTIYVGQTRAKVELVLCGSQSKKRVEW